MRYYMGKVINVQNFYMAKITEADGVITHSAPEKVFGVMKINRVPVPASGELYEEGTLSESISEITGHNLAIDFGDLPIEWSAHIQGLTIEGGIITDDGPCKPKPFALGFELSKANGTKQMMWYLYCLAKPIESTDEQRTKDINISNDTINVTAFKKEQFAYRAYVMGDTSETAFTTTMQGDFFKKVQTSKEITAPVGG